jgi:hypothetical protein
MTTTVGTWMGRACRAGAALALAGCAHALTDTADHHPLADGRPTEASCRGPIAVGLATLLLAPTAEPVDPATRARDQRALRDDQVRYDRGDVRGAVADLVTIAPGRTSAQQALLVAQGQAVLGQTAAAAANAALAARLAGLEGAAPALVREATAIVDAARSTMGHVQLELRGTGAVRAWIDGRPILDGELLLLDSGAHRASAFDPIAARCLVHDVVVRPGDQVLVRIDDEVHVLVEQP